MKKIIIIIFSAIGLLLLLMLSGITLPLSFLDSKIEAAASRMLERKVEIQGGIRLSTSLYPSIELEGLSISNPQGWPEGGKLIDVGRGRIQLSLLSLFRGEIEIEELEFEGGNVQLVNRADNSANYQFTSLDEKTDESEASFKLAGVGELTLRNVQIEYRDDSEGKEYKLKIDEAVGKAESENPLQLSAQGSVLGEAYSLELTGDSLAELIEGTGTWSIAEGQLNFASVTMDLSGAINRSGAEILGQLSVSITGDDLNEIGRLLDTPLPLPGGFSLRSEVNIQSGVIRFDNVELAALDNSVEGAISYNYGDEQPILKATLSIPELDTKLFLPPVDVNSSASTVNNSPTDLQTGSAPDPEPDKEDDSIPPVPWEMLKLLDADVSLHVGRLQHEGLVVKDFKMAVTLLDGNLSSPVSFIYEDKPVIAKLAVNTSGDVPEIVFSYASESIALAPILKVMGEDGTYTGQTGSVVLDGSSQGLGIMDIVNNFTLNMQLADTSLSTKAGRMFAVKALSLQLEPGGLFLLTGKGEFLERPFNLTAKAATSTKIKDADFFTMDLRACDSRLKLTATDYLKRKDDLITYSFSLSGKKLCSYLEPLEEYVGKDAAFRSVGNGRLTNEEGTLVLKTLKLGTIVVDAKARLDVNAGGKPLLTVDVHSDSLDLMDYLSDDSATEPEKTSADATGNAKQSSQQQNADEINELLEQELLPELSFLKSANVNFHLEELKVGPGRVTNIKISTKMRKGALADAPFQASIGDKLFTGDVKMDLASKAPSVHIELATKGFDLPVMLGEFQIDDAPKLTAENIDLLLEFKGKNLEKMLQQSSQVLTIKGGKFQIERVFGEALWMDIKQASYESRPNTPTRIDLKGHLDDQPFSIDVTMKGFFSEQYDKPMTLDARINLADTELLINGKVFRKAKYQASNTQLHTALSGDRMSSLNNILGLDLPPLGPYKIEGSLDMLAKSISLNDILLKIGDSVLKGEVIVQVTTNEAGELNYPIDVASRFDAETIQLNDFQLAGWSALSGSKDSAVTPDEGSPQQDKVEEADEDEIKFLIDQELAEKFNASLEVKVEEVLSGSDKLGSGMLNASLDNGTYSLDKLHLDIPGGAVNIQGSLKPEKDRILTRLDMQINQLDYGVLARRAQADSDLKGIFNLKLALNSEAESPEGIKGNLNGQVQFGVIPEEYKSGAIDLWAVNILSAALPVMMKGNKSEVNCLAGDISLVNGIVEPELFMLDTSKIRVEGKGQVDLKTDLIDFHLKPTPKSAHFFSAATPIKISGNIFEPHIGVGVGSVIATVFRMATSIVVAPLKKIFTRGLDADGKDVCEAAMDWVVASDE